MPPYANGFVEAFCGVARVCTESYIVTHKCFAHNGVSDDRPAAPMWNVAELGLALVPVVVLASVLVSEPASSRAPISLFNISSQSGRHLSGWRIICQSDGG